MLSLNGKVDFGRWCVVVVVLIQLNITGLAQDYDFKSTYLGLFIIMCYILWKFSVNFVNVHEVSHF